MLHGSALNLPFLSLALFVSIAFGTNVKLGTRHGALVKVNVKINLACLPVYLWLSQCPLYENSFSQRAENGMVQK